MGLLDDRSGGRQPLDLRSPLDGKPIVADLEHDPLADYRRQLRAASEIRERAVPCAVLRSPLRYPRAGSCSWLRASALPPGGDSCRLVNSPSMLSPHPSSTVVPLSLARARLSFGDSASQVGSSCLASPPGRKRTACFCPNHPPSGLSNRRSPRPRRPAGKAADISSPLPCRSRSPHIHASVPRNCQRLKAPFRPRSSKATLLRWC